MATITTNGELGTVKLILRALYGGERSESAERLFSRFGSLHGILNATEAELVETGLTPRVASFFTFMSPFIRSVFLRSAPAHIRVNEAAAVEFASRFFVDFDKPCDYIFVAEDDGSVRHYEKLFGNPVRAVIGIACRQNAKDVMWIRFRPRETTVEPNAARLIEVRRAAKSLYAMGINLIDYIEYGACVSYSLRRETVGAGSGKSRDEWTEYDPDDGFCEKLGAYVEAKTKGKY